MADEKATAEKLPTATEFAGAIEFVMKNKPDELTPLINSTVVVALKKIEELEGNLKKLVVLLLKTGVIKGASAAAPQQAAAEAPVQAVGAATVVPTGSGASRTGADGRPLTPQEVAVEEMMDHAEVDNSQPAPVIANQGPAQKRGSKVQHANTNGNGNGGSQRVGADGKPLTPQEAAIEDMMDTAVVDNG